MSRYTADFRLRIVKNVFDTGSVAEVTEKYKINASTVYEWMKKYEDKKERAFYDGPSLLIDEIERLREENKHLKNNVSQCVQNICNLISD